jgi:succinyl-diaminopimelate desuccinylase
VRLARTTSSLRGTLVLLFDADEHTGDFGGAQRYFEGLGAPTDVAGVVIGYPGMDELVVGGRGVCRAKLTVYGRAAHSGSTSSAPNAVVKAADLVHALSTAELPVAGAFPLPAKLTVTTIAGGESFSIVPDRCELSVDVRTTPTFDPGAAIAMMRNLIAEVDAGWPGTRTSNLDLVAAWPAYSLPEDAPLRAALLDAANAFGLDLPARVAGPSNIGNYLAGLGIPATAGFGVDYIGLHGTDERIRVDSIPVILAVHHAALLRLMSQRRQSPEGKEQP